MRGRLVAVVAAGVLAASCTPSAGDAAGDDARSSTAPASARPDDRREGQEEQRATAQPSTDELADVHATVDTSRDLPALEQWVGRHPAADERDRDLERLPTGEVPFDEWLVATMEVMAGWPGDGHSGVLPLAQPDLPMWPIQLYPFDDGWRVVAAAATHDDLVGAPVTAIGGLPPDEAAARVAPLVAADNDASRLGRTPQLLVVPAVLTGLGLPATLELAGGPVEPERVTSDEYAETFGLFDPLVCPGLPGAFDPVFDVRRDGASVVVRYRRVTPAAGGDSVSGLIDELDRLVEEQPPERLVLDLRDNPGGDLATGRSLLDAVRQVEGGGARLVLLVGRCTFSAASLYAAELFSDVDDAVVVGEPMGGSPRIWADASTRALPSGVVVHVATTPYEAGAPELPMMLEPDVAVPPTWASEDAGVDDALTAATTGDLP